MSGPAVVATFVTIAFGLLTLAWGVAHTIEVRAMAKTWAVNQRRRGN
jgi:hypothetical protein